MERHILPCPGTNQFLSTEIAGVAITKTLAGEGIYYYSHISQIHPQRTIPTGWIQFGVAVHGCKLVLSEQNWLITDFPI